MSQVNLHRSAVADDPTRVLYTLAPSALVRIGPDLHTALDALTQSLIDAYISKGYKIDHIATTYSPETIALLFDCFALGSSSRNENDNTNFNGGHKCQFKVYRIRISNGKVVGRGFENAQLRKRVFDQLSSIRLFHVDIPKPFICMETWTGLGPKDSPIYEQMVQASTSLEAFRAFRASVWREHREESRKPLVFFKRSVDYGAVLQERDSNARLPPLEVECTVHTPSHIKRKTAVHILMRRYYAYANLAKAFGNIL